jgi:quercetin dioxygenase-like cupin family protein
MASGDQEMRQHPLAGGSTMSEQQRQRAMTFFRMDDAPTLDDDGMMSTAAVNIDPAVFATFDASQLGAGQLVKVLFKGAGPDDFSLVHARFEPGFRLPRHSHSSDCLYVVIAGEAHMGTRVLKPGDGFFIKADAPYAYSAGPEGVEVLEFRAATSFDIKIRDTSVEDWKPVADAVLEQGESWAKTRAGVA